MKTNNPYYKTMMICLDKVKQEGFTTEFNFIDGQFSTRERKYDPSEIRIVNTIRFEDTEDEEKKLILYLLQTTDNNKGIFIYTPLNKYDISLNRFLGAA